MFAAAMLGTMLLLPLSGGTEIDGSSSKAPMEEALAKCSDKAAKAVLIEATIPKESLMGQKMVAKVLRNRTEDGRWGKTVCETVDMKYPSLKRTETKVRVKHGKRKTFWKKVVRFVKRFTCDFSFRCMKRFDDVKGSDIQQAEARLAVETVFGDNFEEPAQLRGALYYMYRVKSGKGSVSWFDCVTEELGKADEHDYHVFYKDADEAALSKRYVEMSACRGYIDRARAAMSQQKGKLPPAETVEILKTPET